jgi:hypothetical protein
MVDPILPAGATIAAFVMTVLSWYGMLRTGLQLIHNDIEANKSAAEDIANIFTDLKHQENAFNDWRRSWLISKTTPNEVLLQFWGDQRLWIINDKLRRIEADFARTRKHLRRFAELEEREWKTVGKVRRSLMKQEFILFKKAYVQELVDRWPKNMAVIMDEANAGWRDQQRLNREIAHISPYHTLMAYSLVKIARQSQSDAEALGRCCLAIQGDFVIILDLDIFDVAASMSGDKEVPRIGDVLRAGHLKLDLLLREANQPDAQLVRVEVERSFEDTTPESRIVDAFRAVLGSHSHKAHFSSDHSTLFGLSKTRRVGDPCSRLRHTFRDILARHDPPSYNDAEGQFIDHNLILGELSTYRVAFELAQASLLFLRTPWFAEICRCGIRCETLLETEPRKWHQFGLETTHYAHKKPLWQDPHGSFIEGELEYSWCAKDYHWDTLNKPLRHLGLLLVEFALGTIVIPETKDGVQGAAQVVAVLILVKGDGNMYEWKRLTQTRIQSLVRQSFHDSDGFAEAIGYCLTGTFPQSPTDDKWETYLRQFYFRVVKP